jgi:hypothetical protein
VEPEDLHPAEAPTVALSVQPAERRWHDPPPEAPRDVKARPTGLEHPQRCLCVFADAPLVPTTDALERASTKEAHRAHERHAVALVARRHHRQVEALVGVNARRVVGAPFVVPVALEGLDKADPLVAEVRGGLPEVVRLDNVVSVDEADDFGAPVGVAAQGEVARARLVSRPGCYVDELHTFATSAVVLHRTVNGGIARVVVDHDDLEIWVVDLLDRLDGRNQQLGRLVVRRDVQ